MKDNDWSEIIREIFISGWDRTITYLCFIAYGTWSMLAPQGSTGEAFPPWLNTVFNLEIIVAGTVLMVAMILDSFWMRWLGFGIYFVGMLTVAGLIATGSGSPLSVLMLGFAMQGLISLRNVAKVRTVNQELGRMIGELERKKDGS